MFVGYQANGTLGRMLLEGVQQVKLFGEMIAVKASIHKFCGAFRPRGHKNGLLEWIGKYADKPQKVFVVHGEEETCLAFTETIKGLGFDAIAPNFEMEYDLATDTVLQTGISVDRLMERREEHRESPVYARLEAEGQQLMDLIRGSKGMPNRDTEKFAKQVAALLAQWK